MNQASHLEPPRTVLPVVVAMFTFGIGALTSGAVSGTARAGEPASASGEPSGCEEALFEPITVGFDGVNARDAFELVVTGAGLELDMQAETGATVTLAREFVLAVEVLDDVAGLLDLQWRREGCRVIVRPAEQPGPAEPAGTEKQGQPGGR